MRSIIAINASPRKKGTSVVLLDECKKHLEQLGDSVRIINLYSHLQEMQALFDEIDAADTIVICGPCYINTYPADTTRLLEHLALHPEICHGQNLYGVIQGGMPYAHTHVSGLRMLKIFSKKVNINYQGGFVMGLGAMLDGQPLDKLPNGKKVIRQFEAFCEHIHNGEKSLDSVYEASLFKSPGFMFRILAALMNRRIDRIYAARGIDVYQPSPYSDDI